MRKTLKKPKIRIKKDFLGFGVFVILTIFFSNIWVEMSKIDIFADRGSRVRIEIREIRTTFIQSYSTYKANLPKK